MKIAILYICIGKYIEFLDLFYKSCEKFFLPNIDKHYFLFTNIDNFVPNEKQSIIYQDDMGWPGNTLFRFKFFQKCKSELQQYDYIFFFNGNTQFLQTISPEEIIPSKEESYLTGLSWSNIYKDKLLFPYDRNPLSKAYIPIGEGDYYYQGGLIGGRSQEFLILLDKLSKNIDNDFSKGIIAVNHDESHLNHFFLHKNIKVLNAQYGRPEEHATPTNPKIIFRDKNKVLGKKFVNTIKKRTIYDRIIKKILFFIKNHIAQ